MNLAPTDVQGCQTFDLEDWAEKASRTTNVDELKKILDEMRRVSGGLPEAVLSVHRRLILFEREAKEKERNEIMLEARNDYYDQAGEPRPLNANVYAVLRGALFHGADFENRFRNVMMLTTCRNRRQKIALFVPRVLLPVTERQRARQSQKSWATATPGSAPELEAGDACAIGDKIVVSLLVNTLETWCLAVLADTMGGFELIAVPLKRLVDARGLLGGALSYASYGRFLDNNSEGLAHPLAHGEKLSAAYGRNALVRTTFGDRVDVGRKNADNFLCVRRMIRRRTPLAPVVLPFLPSSQVR